MVNEICCIVSEILLNNFLLIVMEIEYILCPNNDILIYACRHIGNRKEYKTEGC